MLLPQDQGHRDGPLHKQLTAAEEQGDAHQHFHSGEQERWHRGRN
jgi:hypothetical protein